MDNFYLWIKVLHVLAFVSWMAGLFYLPRLFVYHAESGKDGAVGPTFVVMERRLLRAIMRPAAIVTVGAGLVLMWAGGWYGPIPGWLWAKVVLVACLGAFHMGLEVHAVRFAEGAERRSGKYFRIINEIPTVLLIGIVVLVVIKPF